MHNLLRITAEAEERQMQVVEQVETKEQAPLPFIYLATRTRLTETLSYQLDLMVYKTAQEL